MPAVAPPDRYRDVVGWPTVTFVAHEARYLQELDTVTGEGKETFRYLRLEKGNERWELDMALPGVEVAYRADNMTVIASMPLWVARRCRLPVEDPDA